MSSTPLDFSNPRFRQTLIVGGACLIAVVAGVVLAEDPYLIFAGAIAVLYAATLSVNARALAWLVIALQPAALIVPFFPGRPFGWELCALLAWPSLLVWLFVNLSRHKAVVFDGLEKRALTVLVGYLVVLCGLMLYRGVGFRAFGGQQMGGRFYAQQVILAILPLLILTVSLSRKQLWGAIVCGWLLAPTYLISDFSFSLGGGAMQPILYFFEIPTDAMNFEVGYELTGMRRYQSLWACAAAGLALMWATKSLREWVGRYALFGIPLMTGLLCLGLGSGHRTLLIMAITTLLFLSVFQRFWTAMRTMVGLSVVAVLLAGLYLASAQLPLPVQRSISFLPGIEVSELADHDAVATLNDRFEVLKLAADDMPEYWLAGRGFGMERLDQLPSDGVHSGVWLQYVNGLIYNGTLGLLVKTGVIGFMLTLLFVFWVSKMALQLIRAVQQKEQETWDNVDRFSLLVCAQWFSAVIFFYLLHGDAATWMQVFSLPAALIMGCRRLQLIDTAEPVSE